MSQPKTYHFWVYGPPPIQRRMRGSTHYKPKENIADEQRIVDGFLAYYPAFPRSDRKFSLEIKIYSKKRCDGSNVEKCVEDALNKRLWNDDRQIRQGFWVFMDSMPLHEECIEVRALEF